VCCFIYMVTGHGDGHGHGRSGSVSSHASSRRCDPTAWRTVRYAVAYANWPAHTAVFGEQPQPAWVVIHCGSSYSSYEAPQRIGPADLGFFPNGLYICDDMCAVRVVLRYCCLSAHVMDAALHGFKTCHIILRSVFLFTPPCKIRHLPLDCLCNSGVNRQYRRGVNGKTLGSMYSRASCVHSTEE